MLRSLANAWSSSVQCGQCREGWWEGPTPSGWSGRRQEGSILWANCTRLACFSGVFSCKCLPVNWNGCGECGGGSRDRQGGHGDRMTTCPHRLQLQTSWTGVILTGKMAFQSVKCLAKVVSIILIRAGRKPSR